MQHVSRRRFLQGTGIALSLPAFESFAAGASNVEKSPRRLVCVGNHPGFYRGNFFPKATGKDYLPTSTLKPLVQHRNDLTVFSHLDHGLNGGHNGVDASPVSRGIYVLEKLLGYTPRPPPPDVPAIEPDIRGAVSIREQLEKHREAASCAECHRKIDPLGFALENFGAVGGWRDNYEDQVAIDSAGKLSGGNTFQTVAEFRTLLMQRQSQFNRCLTEKLMTDALGQELEINDRPGIDLIVTELNDNEAGLADLIRLVVLSKPFRNN